MFIRDNTIITCKEVRNEMGYLLKVVYSEGKIISAERDLLDEVMRELRMLLITDGRKGVETIVIMKV